MSVVLECWLRLDADMIRCDECGIFQQHQEYQPMYASRGHIQEIHFTYVCKYAYVCVCVRVLLVVVVYYASLSSFHFTVQYSDFLTPDSFSKQIQFYPKAIHTNFDCYVCQAAVFSFCFIDLFGRNAFFFCRKNISIIAFIHWIFGYVSRSIGLVFMLHIH